MKLNEQTIYRLVTIAIVLLIFCSIFMLGYISGSVITKIEVSKIQIRKDILRPQEEELLMAIAKPEPKDETEIMHVLAYSKKPQQPIDLYAQYVCDICSEYKFVDDLPLLIMAMMEVESNFNPYLTSSAGCIGLMQVSPYWQKDRAERLGVEDLWDEYGNILVAVDFLQDLYYNYANEDIVLSVMMYNMDFSAARSMYNRGQWSVYASNVFEIFDSMKGGS